MAASNILIHCTSLCLTSLTATAKSSRHRTRAQIPKRSPTRKAPRLEPNMPAAFPTASSPEKNSPAARRLWSSFQWTIYDIEEMAETTANNPIIRAEASLNAPLSFQVTKSAGTFFNFMAICGLLCAGCYRGYPCCGPYCYCCFSAED